MCYKIAGILFFFLLSTPLSQSFALTKRSAIARFDVVPYQIIDKPFDTGVIAFHMNGIKAVDFKVTDGTTLKSYRVHKPSINPRTNVQEYWISIDPAIFQDGILDITAQVIPKINNHSETRQLNLKLYANANGKFNLTKTVYVSLKGDNKNAGTKEAPLASVISALYKFHNTKGGKIVLLEEGTYFLGTSNKRLSPINLAHWVTIAPAQGLERDKVILTNKVRSLVRLYSRMIHWKNLSFDFDKIKQIYNGEQYYWFENCRWFSSGGRGKKYKSLLPNLRNYYYVTDSLVHDMIYGFHFCKLLRNSKIQNISGDAIQKNLLTVNIIIDNVGGELLKHHSDVYQMWDEMDNVILFNVKATNLTKTQAIFLQPVNDIPKNEPVVAMTNSAFIDCSFINAIETGPGNNPGGPPFSQMQSSFEHILFRNVSLPWQHFVFRTDMIDNRAWNARDVIFEDCQLHYLTFKKYINSKSSKYKGPVPGVTFINCHAAPIYKKQ